jgi:cytochrome P450
VLTETYAYEPFDAAMHLETYPAELYRWMRNECPLYRNDEHDFWALSRFADIQAVARDWETYSSSGPRGIDLDGTGPDTYGEGNFLEIDPPRHDVLRDVVRKAFSAREIGSLEASVSQEARSLVAAIRSSGSGDVGMELCWPLAFNVVMGMLGMPAADRPSVERRLLDALTRTSGTEDIPGAALSAAAELRQYTSDLLRDRALPPGILRQVADARSSGLLSDAEAPGLGMVLMFAGIETPAIFAANAVVLLAQHPRQRDLLRRGESAGEAAIEELIRYESPVQALARTTTAPVELHGIDLPIGSTVLLVYGAANRDERRWGNGDELDLARPHMRNVAFGEGLHFCLGAMLTRLMARVVVEALLDVAPEYEVRGPIRRTVKWCDWGVLGASIIC